MDTTAGGVPGTARAGRTDGPAPQQQQLIRPTGGRAVDAAGMVVLACCAVWALICAAGRDARPEDTLLALLAVTSGYAAGRVLGALLPVLTPAVGAVVVLALVLAPPFRPAAGGHAPLGDPAADSALLVLAAGAACCAAWGAPRPVVRVALLLVAAGAAVAALALGSVAGCAACAATLLWSLAAGRTRRRATGLAVLALLAALVVGASYAVAVNALPSGLSGSLTGQLTRPRVELWHQAVGLARHHPLRGVGPGRFAEASERLPADTPVGPTPRSAPFQLAAEQGVVGVALLAAAYAWALCALWRSPRPTPVVLTAAAALTGLALLASVDPVLGYTAITASAGLLTGLTTSRPLLDP